MEETQHSNPLLQRRRAGVLLHPTSLPGPHSVGTLGDEAFRFVNWAASAGFTLWQVLPLHPVQSDGSPYASISAFAGDPRMIDPARLAEATGIVDDGRAVEELLERAGAAVAREEHALHAAYRVFLEEQGPVWLDDFALFCVIRARHDDRPWWEWDPELRDRQPEALARVAREEAQALEQVRFVQFVFADQWRALHRHANDCGLLLLGDMPIFVAHDSADVWSHRDLFDLDERGQPRTVAGVPPDYFSETGQRWGNPQYRWDRLAETGYAWWIRRVRRALETVDALRIDHFRGFESSWAIPAEEPDAIRGYWFEGPGAAFFEALGDELGYLPVLAEDLGVITPEVTALRERFDFPGMRILQFAFEGGEANPYLPANHDEMSAVYTGTHDNDTTVGWFASLDEPMQLHVLNVLGEPEDAADTMPWPLIRTAYASPARIAILPMQDVLELDAGHRMNRPGTVEGNWDWRFDWEWVPGERAGEMRALAEAHGRLPPDS
ncbi:4-alpha-glucanotransferase [Thioalkalivibrio sp. ALE21]|uniref:4-alpha-glucanotransferase n=1 Tax=Thioalkalivibrio sp. ALE21 TaxID=1158175 RepID=UPI000D8222E3|nr:4-alpha-glucanotransferase [Thioalkalivibrio sp. ALE21]PYG02762.1 4-alpha-glucanotransferase [Thioalkalivibrio sp. ALE21]